MLRIHAIHPLPQQRSINPGHRLLILRRRHIIGELIQILIIGRKVDPVNTTCTCCLRLGRTLAVVFLAPRGSVPAGGISGAQGAWLEFLPAHNGSAGVDAVVLLFPAGVLHVPLVSPFLIREFLMWINTYIYNNYKRNNPF